MNELIAVVQKIVLEGKHGPYAVAISDSFPGWITFSLENPVWEEAELPSLGIRVVLSDFQKKTQWRANKARFLRPSDEAKTTSSEKTSSQEIVN